MAFQNTAFQTTAFLLAGLTSATATMDWQQPLSRAPAKRVLYYQSSVTVTTIPAYPRPLTVSIDGPRVNFKRTLQYQAKAWCPQPIAESNSTTGSGFYAQLSTAPSKTWPPRAAADVKQFEVPEPWLSVEWLRPFDGPIPLVRQQTRQPLFIYNQTAVDNNITGTGWHVPFPGPRAKNPLYYQVDACSDKVDIAAVTSLSTTVTIGGPRVNFKRTLQYQSLAFCPQPPTAAVVNTRTEWDWHLQWKGPPRYRPPKIAAQPFTPKEAVLDNTVTPDKWLFRFAKAVPAPKPRPTQPFFGYPYEVQAAEAFSSASSNWAYLGKKTLFYQSLTQRYYPPEAAAPNSITGSGFHMPLAGAPDKRWPPLGAYENRQFATPGARLGIEWLQRWQGPPRYRPRSEPFQPFVPKEVVVENTVTPDKWLFRFAKAVPTPKPVPTQPFFGYPYLAADNTVTPDKWLLRWQGPPRYRPIKVQTPPFVPKEAVLENTQTPDKWLFRFQKAVPGRPVWRTQPFFGYPYADLYIIGGPADEPERVVCVLASSRVAVVPELDRIATPLPSDTLVASNVFEDMPCPPFGNEDGIPEEDV